MQKFTKAIAAIMLTVAVVCAAGCKKPEDPNNGGNNGGNGGGNGGGSNPTREGIYLGIIGFNNKIYPKNIGLLDNSTLQNYYSFIDGLSMADNTKLYYADYTALQQLKSYNEPPKLTNVALVTFTDGLDNASLAPSSNPDNYASTEDYIASINNKIQLDKVHGNSINAYSIGLRGNDVNDNMIEQFRSDLRMLASNDDNVFEVASMGEALERFSEIAESLHSVTTTASLSVLVPPGYNDGKIIRFTFDNISVNQVDNSTRYIECTYKRPGTGIRLDNITYHGFQTGASSLYSNEMDENESYKFVFENLVKSNGDIISSSDTTFLRLYRKDVTGWVHETEFKPGTSSHIDEEQSSALIMLVLDCTTSLGSEFSSLKNAAKRFVETLVSSNNGGSNGGGGNGQQEDQTFTVNSISFTMKHVQGGTFWMGAQNTNPNGQNYDGDAYNGDAYNNESPVHSVTLSTFYIGETEVTQALWQAVMGNNPSYFSGTTRPVESVSWNAIVNQFIPALNALTGRTFRLPTEAEWEYAARGGNLNHGYKYAGSNSIDDVAWYMDNSDSQTHPVGTKTPNELGIYDMSGNVFEWCSDWHGNYDEGSQTNPQGPSSGLNRVYRGGSLLNSPRNCRVSYRIQNAPNNTSRKLGFRLVLSP